MSILFMAGNTVFLSFQTQRQLRHGLAFACQLCALSMLLLLAVFAGFSIFAYDLIAGTQFADVSRECQVVMLLISAVAGASAWGLSRSAGGYHSRTAKQVASRMQVWMYAALIASMVVAGVTIYVSQVNRVSNVVADHLAMTARLQANALRTYINTAQHHIDALILDSGVVADIVAHPGQSDNARILERFKRDGVQYASLLDGAGQLIATTGAMPSNLAAKIPLASHQELALLWNGNAWLQVSHTVKDEGHVYATINVMVAMPDVDTLLHLQSDSGASRRTSLCYQSDVGISCLPTLNRADVVPVSGNQSRVMLTPYSSTHWLGSNRFIAHDLHGEDMIVSHESLSDFGLGLSIAAPAGEVYPSLLTLVMGCVGVVASIWMLLTLYVQRSRRQLQSALDRAHFALTERERRLALLSDHASDAILSTTKDGLINAVNPSTCTMFGYTENELLGLPLSMLLPDLQPSGFGAPMNLQDLRYAGKLQKPATLHLTGVLKDGRKIDVLLAGQSALGEDHASSAWVIRQLAQDSAGSASRRLPDRMHFEHTINAIGDASNTGLIFTSPNGQVTYMNALAQTMTGWANSNANGRPIAQILDLLDESSGTPTRCTVDLLVRGERRDVARGDFILLQRSGGNFLIEEQAAPVRDEQGELIAYVCTFKDVGQIRGMMKQISYQASHDSLTGLLNRREFLHRLSLTQVRAKFDAQTHCLLYLDLDRFKRVNDQCGHTAGDELLKQLAAVLQRRLRQSDTLGRLGGDEFGIILDGCDESAGMRIAESIRMAIESFRFNWRDQTFELGASIGLLSFCSDRQSIEALIDCADSACYAAKSQGRNQIHVYRTGDESAPTQSDALWVARIQRAIDGHRFELHVQHIVSTDADRGQVEHYEFLLRMRDEEDTLVPPMAFLPVAQRHGLMKRIDQWVVAAALDHYPLLKRDESSPLTLFINVAGTSCLDHDFLDHVEKLMRARKIKPEVVCLEISEQDWSRYPAEFEDFIVRAKHMGLRIAIDDFVGGSATSLANLKRLGLDFIKIDGRFIREMLADPLDYSMVESLNVIGHVMGIRTIAECTETNDAVIALRKLGVDLVQGNAISAPSPL